MKISPNPQRAASRINPDFKRRYYSGPFAVSITETAGGNPAVDVNAGVFELATGDLEIDAQTEFEIDISQDGTLYVYFDVYSQITLGAETLVYVYASSFTKPVLRLVDYGGEERWTYPVICAELEIETSEAVDRTQIQFGNHRASGVLS